MPPEMMGAMPPEMMGAMPPEMMGGGAMPPEMMGGGAMPPEMMGGMPPEDPIMILQQEVSELRDLMQQLIDGQTAILESLVGGSESQKAPAEEETPAPPIETAPAMEAPMMADPAAMGMPMGMPMDMPMGMPMGGAPVPPPMSGGDAELMNIIQQGLRA
jgi:hypothetical protein